MRAKPSFLATLGLNLRDLADGASAGFDRAVNEDRIKIAVTGLSRAGKTVFITSLIQNLVALGVGRNTLPGLNECMVEGGISRLRGIRVEHAGASLLPYFDHAAKFRDLASELPTWPPRTEDLAQVSLTIDLDRKAGLSQRLGPRRVQLDILDYPGEWLLDLPLLDQSFNDWSIQTLVLLRQEPRRTCAAAFLDFLDDLRPTDRLEESAVRRGHALYREALSRCRTEHGLRYLQPGRFVCPGPRSDAPFLWFFPMEVGEGVTRPDSVAALLTQRFETYKRDMRETFFDPHFSAFDRQILLVDVLGALYAGRTAFEDTARALSHVASALRYGNSNAGRRLAVDLVKRTERFLPQLGGRANRAVQQALGDRIDKVAFVATKDDHVPALKRTNLRALLRALADPAEIQIRDGAATTYHTISSVLSTVDDRRPLGDGKVVDVVKGIVLGEDKVRAFHVGEVPAGQPPESFWTDCYFEMPVFRPPALDHSGDVGIPNRGIDAVLTSLIGDLL